MDEINDADIVPSKWGFCFFWLILFAVALKQNVTYVARHFYVYEFSDSIGKHYISVYGLNHSSDNWVLGQEITKNGWYLDRTSWTILDDFYVSYLILNIWYPRTKSAQIYGSQVNDYYELKISQLRYGRTANK